MNRSRLDGPYASRMVAFILCTSAALVGADALAAGASGGHLAVDGISLSLDDGRAVRARSASDVDALGLRVRAGLEFGARSTYQVTHHRSRRHADRRGPRRERAPDRGPYRGPRLGVEMHAAFAHGEHAGTLEQVDTSLLGGYLTGRVPLGDYLSLKGLVGLTSLAIDREADLVDRTDRLSGVGFGVGLEAAVGRYTDLTVDWMRYLADENDDEAAHGIERVSAMAIGVKVRF